MRLTVGTACLAVVAGFLTVPVAQVAPAIAAVADVAGIETAGPIPAIAGTGPKAPALPPGVAVMPRGALTSGHDPLVYDARLVDAESVSARLIYLSAGRDAVVFSGDMKKGWLQVSGDLAPGGDYEVSVAKPDGSWQSVGTFNVATRGGGVGPMANVGGMSVSTVTGEVAWSWTSEGLAGPDGSTSATLQWSSGMTSSPGLPDGWRLGINSGSPWASLSERGPQVSALEVPAPPAARKLSATRAEISFDYNVVTWDPRGEFASGGILQWRKDGGRWRLLTRTELGHVTATGRIPRGHIEVRLGVKAEDTTLWSRPVTVSRSARPPLQSAQPNPLPTSGRNSIVTAGDAPLVVTLRGWDGTLMSFVRNDLGVYEQANGTAVPGYTNTLVRVNDAEWEFADTQGTVTRFVNGKPVSVTVDGQVITRMAWDGSGRLASVTNRSNRTMTFTYAGAGSCADWTADGFDAAPTGKLCRISYPGDVATDLGYADGYLSLVKDPGNQGTTLGWDSVGRLVSTRSTLVSQVATREPAAKGVVSRVEYDAQGRAFALVDQPAEAGAASPRQEISFPVVNDQVLRAAIANPEAGVTARVRMVDTPGYRPAMTYQIDPLQWTTISARDAAGLSTTSQIDPKTGRLARAVDAQSRAFRYEYDDRGLVVKTSGPFTTGAGRAAGDGLVTTTDYDSARVNGRDEPLSGLRAQVYGRPQFGGDATAEFWAASRTEGGLSASWKGRPGEFSAQATGVWVPNQADDAKGARDGWQFLLTASSDADASFIIGGTVCIVNTTCTVRGVPAGPKQVTVQLARAGANGYFSVQAAPVGAKVQPLPYAEVGPGYALVTTQASNDVPGGQASETRYFYADPASGRPTRVQAPGDLTTTLAYEPGRSGRLLTRTTPGGLTQSTAYWPVDGSATLPAVCGGGTNITSGQPSTLTRQDGTTITTYFDIRGRVIASVSGDETTCITYAADSSVGSTSVFNASGLIERTDSVEAVGGDPRVSSSTTTHGDAAVVDPGGSITSTARVDLLGRVVASTSPAGVTTATTYDILSNPTKVVHTPPTGAALTFEYAYRPYDGALLTQKVNGVVAATVAYDEQTGRVSSVTYPNGIRSTFGYFGSGQLDSVTVATGDERFSRVISSLNRADSGRIQSASLTVRGRAAMTENRSFTYDEVGRLTRAVISSDGARSTFDYGYGAQDPSCGSTYAAGNDNLRTAGSRNDASFVDCYNSGGRLTSTTDPALGGKAVVSYDAMGRVTSISGARALALRWASSTTLAEITETASDGFVRTTFDTYNGGIFDKTVTTDGGSSTLRYAGPFLLSVADDKAAGVAATQYGLPGGATVTIDAGAQAVISLAGADGSALLSISAPALGSGTTPQTGLAPRFGPYGEPLVMPTSTSAVPAYTWQAGSRQETLPGTSSVTLLGARPYHPWLGQFLAPDPEVDSGNNMYSYTNGDPINQSDRSGNEADALDWVARSLGAVTLILGLGGGIAAAKIGIAGNTLKAGKVAAWVGAVGAVTGLAAAGTQIASMVTSSNSVSWDQWVTSIGSAVLSLAAVGAAVTGVKLYRQAKAAAERRAWANAWDDKAGMGPQKAAVDAAKNVPYVPSKPAAVKKQVRFGDQREGGHLATAMFLEGGHKSGNAANTFSTAEELVFRNEAMNGIDNPNLHLALARPDLFPG